MMMYEDSLERQLSYLSNMYQSERALTQIDSFMQKKGMKPNDHLPKFVRPSRGYGRRNKIRRRANPLLQELYVEWRVAKRGKREREGRERVDVRVVK